MALPPAILLAHLTGEWLQAIGYIASACICTGLANAGLATFRSLLARVVGVARDYRLPVQVSLEEFMACAVGGCAGCTVRINTADGPAMKRVCVDGPVFDAQSVNWN